MTLLYYEDWRPRGLGTSEVESLTSAVRRIAHGETRGVGRVLRELVIVPYLQERADRQPIIQPTRVTETVNGASRTTRVIVSRLGASGIAALERTTLLGRDAGVEFREAFRSVRAWCRDCLAESGDEAYDRLIWALRATLSCVRHGIELASMCQRCRRGHRPWHAKANPWSCPHCGELLSIGERTTKSDLVSRRVSELIGLFERGRVLDLAMIAGGFSALAARAGGIRHLAERLDHSVSGLSTVSRGLTRPHLALLLRALALAQEPLEALLAHQPVSIAARHAGRPRRRAPLHDGSAPLRAELEAALRSAATPSLRAFAQSHHTDPATLRTRYPALCSALVSRRRRAAARRHRAAEAAVAARVTTAFRRLVRSGLAPSRRELEVALGQPGLFRAPQARIAYRGIFCDLRGVSAGERFSASRK